MLYQKLNGNVKCALCAHRCNIADGRGGICGVRENHKGILYSLVYRKAVSVNIDPIEKKPLFHFLPGSTSYSLATVGCNFRCKFCQNADISQASKGNSEIIGQDISPDEIVNSAKDYGCRSIAYTYTEPTIFFEYAFDTSKIAKNNGIYNLYVTNGYMTEEMLNTSRGYMDAANVDLKGFTDKFYIDICDARLQPVLDSLKLMKKLGIWVEITTLVIPTLNDLTDELRQMASFIKDELGRETPWHLSRFHPDYLLMDKPSTPVETLNKARQVGLDAGLRYVYTGNVPGERGENTYCYNCGELLVERYVFEVVKNNIENSKCPACGARVDGVWE